MKQFYKIGEISKLYQIGPDSLRYYEELDVYKRQVVFWAVSAVIALMAYTPFVIIVFISA